jgi:hypothetical protein
MRAGRHGLRDFRQMQRHRLGRATGEYQAGSLALSRTDRPEDVSRSGAQIARC